MKDYQSNLVKILEEKGVKSQTLNRWKSGINSPSLLTVEEICEENGIDVFFFDGNIESLLKFNEEIGKQKGFKIQIIFER